MQAGTSYDRCLRCGKGVPWSQSVCRDCIPPGWRHPAPAQDHATVFMSVLAVLAVIALLQH